MTALPIIYSQLKDEYQRLFDTCKVHANRVALADQKLDQIVLHKPQYEAIAKRVNPAMPWWVVGVIHLMECGLSFQKHLHNGDPLTAKTKQVPAGRPPGIPPFTFENSAVDALTLTGWNKETDFSIARILYRLEGYNGYGYRQYHPAVKSPYLWSFSHIYVKGKYVADGRFDSEAVSQQLGIAVVIKRGVERGLINLGAK